MVARAALCLLALTVAIPGFAQSARERASTDPFESYLAVADLLGKPASAANRVWPVSSSASNGADELQLTGAVRIALRRDVASRLAGDTVRIVSSVTYTEVVRDTAALATRATRILRRLQERLGEPELCAGPFGTIGSLFAPQQGTRSWTRGINQLRTQLDWIVTPGGSLLLTVRSGHYIGAPEFERRCDVRLP